MSFSSFKRRSKHSAIIHPNKYDIDRVPRQFCDYMNNQCTRFDDICNLYLDGMTIDDVQYMLPEDFINLVPDEQFRHKLLMTIMVRRYLCRCDENDTVYCKPDRCDTFIDTCTDTHTDNETIDESCSEKIEYKCDKCNHVCTNKKCTHKCSDYTKISKKKC